MTAVAITAHRDLSPDDVVRIRMVMKVLVAKDHIDVIYFGGARGGDTEALKAAIECRGSKKKPQLIVVVPNLLEDQPAEAIEWVRRADTLIELKNPITSEDGYRAYDARNEFMVDSVKAHSEDGCVVAFWNQHRKGGTSNCVNYARRKLAKVEIIAIHGRKV